MTQSLFQLLSTWFTSVWTLLTSFYIPGTNVTPGGMLLFIASAVIGLKFFKRLFGAFGGGADDNG